MTVLAQFSGGGPISGKRRIDQPYDFYETADFPFGFEGVDISQVDPPARDKVMDIHRYRKVGVEEHKWRENIYLYEHCPCQP